jgi:hypothetical protein
MVTTDTLRGEKRADVLRLAERHGARNIRANTDHPARRYNEI